MSLCLPPLTDGSSSEPRSLLDWLRGIDASTTLQGSLRAWPPPHTNEPSCVAGDGDSLWIQPDARNGWIGIYRRLAPEAWLRHEVGNALTAALGWIHLGREQPERLPQALERLERTLGDARSWLQQDEELPADPVDLVTVARGAIANLEAEAERAGVRLRLRAPTSLFVPIAATHLRSIVWNLVRNALEASSPGATVYVHLKALGDRAMLTVHDEGHGMDAATLRRVLRSRYSSKGADRGIGLRLVRHLVERLGGRLRIDSEPGAGSSIRIQLPAAADAAHTEPILPRTPSAPLRPPLSPDAPRVLLVEDDPDLRMLMASLLRSAGCRVVATASAREAQNAQGPFALLVTDEHLPDARGSTLWQRLFARGTVHHGVLCSGDPGARAEHEALRLLRKPFAPETLLRLVSEMLSPPASQRTTR